MSAAAEAVGTGPAHTSEAASATQGAQRVLSVQADLSQTLHLGEVAHSDAALQHPIAQPSTAAVEPAAAATQSQQVASTDLRPLHQQGPAEEAAPRDREPHALQQQPAPPGPGAELAAAADGMAATVKEQHAVEQPNQPQGQHIPHAAEQQILVVQQQKAAPGGEQLHAPQQQTKPDAVVQPTAQQPQRQPAKRPAQAPPSPVTPQERLETALPQPSGEDSAAQEPSSDAVDTAAEAAAGGEQQPQQEAGRRTQQQLTGQQEQQSGQTADGGGGGGGSSGGGAPSRRNTPYICQVDGCGRNLAKEKEYYRRYRVCKSHAGAPEVLLAGRAKRYCQQCSVFHLLADFDGDKRSCRARLSSHNNKRRKKLAQDSSEAAAGAAAAASPATAPRVTRAKLAARNPRPAKSEADDTEDQYSTGGRTPRRGASRGCVAPAAGNGGGAEDLQWAAHGRRGSAAGPRSPCLQPPPSELLPPWLLGLGAGGDPQRLAAAAAAAASPPLPPQYSLQTSSGLLAAAQGYGHGQGPADAASLARHLALAGGSGRGALSGGAISQQAQLAALAGLQGGGDAAIASTAVLQVQLQQLAQAQAIQAAAEAAAAREAAAAQAAAQAAALAQLRSVPQEQRMQDPRAATSLINVARAAMERQRQQQIKAAAEEAATQKGADSRSSAFQPYRPTAVRATPGVVAAAKAAGDAGQLATGVHGSPPKATGPPDWKARVMQRFQHVEAADGDT